MNYKKYLQEMGDDAQLGADTMRADKQTTKGSVISTIVSSAQAMLTSVGDAGLESRDANRIANAIQRLINDLNTMM